MHSWKPLPAWVVPENVLRIGTALLETEGGIRILLLPLLPCMFEEGSV